MTKEVYINYNDEVVYEGSDTTKLVVRCDCGCKFDFQTKPSGFCPRCGGKIVGYKASNVPMDKVPKGYQAFLFDMYETYRDEYYNNADHWHDVFAFQKAIYNKDFDAIEEVFKGWCYVKGFEPIFFRESINTYMGYETKKGNFHKLSEEDFIKKLKDISIKELEVKE